MALRKRFRDSLFLLKKHPTIWRYMYKIRRRFEISCSHRLVDSNLSDKENFELFGRCHNEPSHGHNYFITIEVEKKFLEHGMIVNFSAIKKIFNEKIDAVYDHHFLNDCLAFKKQVVTAEVMAKIFFDILLPHLPDLTRVTIQETSGAEAEYAQDK